jgi:alpha-D-ribose 1-methylphosphonate 5-triphosphate synthase subunit PhnI
MGYIAARGGTAAILNAEVLVEHYRLRGGTPPLTLGQVQHQLRHAVGRAMHEGALYAPQLAALAVKQAEGDSIEASFLLRAYRATLPRVMATLPAQGRSMQCARRISAAFRDIPGGQLLGPSTDYQIRLLRAALARECDEDIARIATLVEGFAATHAGPDVGRFPKVVDHLRAHQMVVPVPAAVDDAEPFDITRQALQFPCPRSARLQALAQADTGSLLTYAYSSVRGYGDAHPTLAELRYGHLPVAVAHPVDGSPVWIGELEATECETVSKAHSVRAGDAAPRFHLGYGFTIGQGEVKAISMAILDSVLTQVRSGGLSGESGPAADEEFVLLHSDGIEASGFTAHYKLPHYVTFEADLQVLERAKRHAAANAGGRLGRALAAAFAADAPGAPAAAALTEGTTADA